MKTTSHRNIAADILREAGGADIAVGPLCWCRHRDGSRDLRFGITRLLAGRPKTTWVYCASEVDRLMLIIALLRSPRFAIHVQEDERDWCDLRDKLWPEVEDDEW